jgi:circadian clock protein KaiB
MIAETSANKVKEHKFILFVSGMSVKSLKAIENINKICDTYLSGNFDLKIIDVYKHPHLATEYQIIGLPTLIKINPMPNRTIIGDLSETDKVLRILDIEK